MASQCHRVMAAAIGWFASIIGPGFLVAGSALSQESLVGEAASADAAFLNFQETSTRRRASIRNQLERMLPRFSGKELFEREWQPIAPSPEEIEQKNKRAELIKDGVFARLSPQLDTENTDGLGPLYNAKSCTACHISGGGSGVEHNVTLLTIDLASIVDTIRAEPARTHLPKLGRDIHSVFPGFFDAQGRLLLTALVHDHSTRDGYQEIRQGLSNFVPNGIADEWFVPEKRQIAAIAAQPVVSGRHDSFDFYLSQRNSPPLFGMGVIERIDDKRLRAIAQSQPKRSDGVVSGRQAGKFGWRGQVASLAAFVSGACAGEMGLNSLLSQQASDPVDRTYTNVSADVNASELVELTSHVASIPRPVESSGDYELSKKYVHGERVFNTIGCDICHVAEIRPAVGIFSDLLLHDMGPNLQAPAPAFLSNTTRIVAPTFDEYRTFEFSSGSYYEANMQLLGFPEPNRVARDEKPFFPKPLSSEVASDRKVFENSLEGLQREWRTPPLWGVADSGPYLHDGRASTLDEAVLWHGGEAETSRNLYEKLSSKDKELVLGFLGSLRAPVAQVQ